MRRDARGIDPAGAETTPPAPPLQALAREQAEQIDALQMQQRDLARRAAELEHELQALRRSSSWRLTAPLRALAQGLRWLAAGHGRVLAREVVRGVAQARARHGLAGMLARLPHYMGRLSQVVARARRQAELPAAPRGAHADVGAARRSAAVPATAPRLHPEIVPGIEQSTPIAATVSVVIPTLNAGPEFAHLLRKLRGQQGVAGVEIVVVDSGSNDHTVALARAAGAVLVQIAPADFSHSGARNLGAESASGSHLLFMVQDAYPIGERWLQGLLRYLLDYEGEGMVALSCTEYCRDDADMMYECSIATHYGFLGCKEFDRVGHLQGMDQESLRAMGQLSDVACLIPRSRFLQYRYRGEFAEDLDLGVRLIQDGHRIAMLASVKVIHSHLRSSHYYLKRTFVDITFLVGVFPDFALPPVESAAGLVRGAAHVARLVSAFVLQLPGLPPGLATHELAAQWLESVRRAGLDMAPLLPASLELGDARVDAVLRNLVRAADLANGGGVAAMLDAATRRSAQYFVDDFAMRFGHFNRYALAGYPGDDARLRHEWAGAAAKTFAASLGFTLAVLYLDRRSRPEGDADKRWLQALAAQLTSGV